MGNEITVVERQGHFYVSDGEREYAIPRGGDEEGGNPTPSTDSGTASTGGDGVQPQEGQQTQQGGQGFIEPYLEGVDDSVRPVVQERLERFRQDQDAQVTRRFEQLRQESEIPVTVYQHLINDPIGTIQWIADRFQEDRGVDVRSQLLQAWQESPQNPENQPGNQQQQDPAETVVTQADIDRILEEREQQRAQEAQQQQLEQQRLQQQTQTVHSWMDEAAKSHGLEFNDADGQPDPLRTAIALQANDLHNSGQARGKAAVEMVVEAMAKRFGTTGSGNNGGQGDEPKTANGGSAPPQKQVDVSDEKQRRAAMLAAFTGGQ